MLTHSFSQPFHFQLCLATSILCTCFSTEASQTRKRTHLNRKKKKIALKLHVCFYEKYVLLFALKTLNIIKFCGIIYENSVFINRNACMHVSMYVCSTYIRMYACVYNL